MFEDVYQDMPAHLREQIARPEAEHGRHDHDPGPALAMDVMLARDDNVVIYGQDVG